MENKMKWEIIAAVCAVLCLLVFLEIIRELKTFTVTHYVLETPKLARNMEEKTIVLLSDLHNCSYGKKNEKLIRAVKKANPDLIVVSGDMLVGKKDVSTETAEHFIKSVQKIAQVYYGNGNHEQRMKERPMLYGTAYEGYRRRLADSGVIFLENGSTSLTWQDRPVRISGLEIPLHYYRKLTTEQIRPEEIEKRIGKASEDALEILIAHNPVHAESYAGWGADLTVSGHLHGGIVRLPFIGGAISPQAILFPKYSGGRYRLGEMDLVVSRGLGTHTVNLRLLNRAEVVVLHMKGTR